MNRLTALGRSIFRVRGILGGAAAVATIVLGRPTLHSVAAGMPLVLGGLVLRFWAMGYIGVTARSGRIAATARIVSGPYRVFRHPLYLGNGLITAGVLLAHHVLPVWALAVAAGFVLTYGLMILTEERQLAGLPVVRPGFEVSRAVADWWAWLGGSLMLALALVRALVSAAV